MRYVIIWSLILMFFLIILGCTESSKMNTIEIIDQNSQVDLKLITKNNYGIFIPPEPPELKDRTIILNGFIHKKEIFSIELPSFELDVSSGFGCDVKWSDDFEYFAVKTTNYILICNKSGEKLNSYYSNNNEKVSSINWNNKRQLLAVIKYPERKDTFGYTVNSVGFKLISISPTPKSVPIILFSKKHHPVTFIFNGIEFNNQEISPESNYFVYSTGSGIELYKFVNNTTFSLANIEKVLHGVWWLSEDVLVLGCDILSNNGEYFYYSISKKELRNITNIFENWDTNDVYNKDWYYNTFKKLIF